MLFASKLYRVSTSWHLLPCKGVPLDFDRISDILSLLIRRLCRLGTNLDKHSPSDQNNPEKQIDKKTVVFISNGTWAVGDIGAVKSIRTE